MDNESQIAKSDQAASPDAKFPKFLTDYIDSRLKNNPQASVDEVLEDVKGAMLVNFKSHGTDDIKKFIEEAREYLKTLNKE